MNARSELNSVAQLILLLLLYYMLFAGFLNITTCDNRFFTLPVL